VGEAVVDIRLCIAAVGAGLLVAGADANVEAAPRPQYLSARITAVRSSDDQLRRLIAEGVSMSPTFAQLVESITLNPTIVYVEWSESLPSRLDAALMNNPTVTPDGTCILRVLVRRGTPSRSLIPLMAHELQHVVELITDSGGDPERRFDQLGTRSGGTYETEQARIVQRIVEQELVSHSSRRR
jgi:hypothetical protein